MAAAGYLLERWRPPWFGYLLVALFGLAILLPLFGTLWDRDRDIVTLENRIAESWPEFKFTRDGLKRYPGEFERFFNDHFGLRGILVRVNHLARAMVFGVSPVPNTLIGKAGWLYFRGEDAKALDRWYRGTEAFTDVEIAVLRSELLRRHTYLSSRGIAYLVVVVPEKYSIYPEYLPDWVTKLSPTTPLDRIARELSRYPELNFIDLRGALREARSGERLYYQTDSHWNYLGATVGYRAIMAEVARLLPGLVVAPASRPPFVAGVDYYSGDQAQMLGLPQLFREDDIAPLGKVLAQAASRCAQRDTTEETPGFEFYVYRCDPRPAHRALIYRDSMAIPLVPLLAENFARSIFVSTHALDPALIERVKPDIVVEEFVERTLNAPAAYPLRVDAPARIASP